MKVGGGYSKQSSQFENETTRTLTPYQEAIQPKLYDAISTYMSDPGRVVRPATETAKQNINAGYRGLADRLRSTFLTTGGGKSGKLGTAALAGETARLSDLAAADNNAVNMEATLPLTVANLAQAFLNTNFGQKSSGTGSSNGWGINASGGFGSSSGTGPGGPWSSSTWG